MKIPTRALLMLVLALALAACGTGAGTGDDATSGNNIAGGDNASNGNNASGGDTGEPAAAFDPNLFPEGKFVPAADVKAAHDAGADILFVDARPEMDYEFGHIPGAVNVPYHDVETHIADLPKDKWIVSYCECPHAEAEQVADQLAASGFEHVRVIDEGLQGWRDLGGEVVGGDSQG